MGLGPLGGEEIVFKRNYRWTFQIETPCGTDIPEYLIKSVARPSLNIEATKLDFLHGIRYIPGKGEWQDINVTFLDVGNLGNNINGLYSWLATLYNFTDPVGLHQSSKRGRGKNSGGYAGNAILRMYDGCGVTMEEWRIFDAWPTSINFGELAYDNSDVSTIELTLKYSQVEYIPYCGGSFSPCCSGCSDTTGGTGAGGDFSQPQ
jgi:hypothetical protein